MLKILKWNNFDIMTKKIKLLCYFCANFFPFVKKGHSIIIHSGFKEIRNTSKEITVSKNVILNTLVWSQMQIMKKVIYRKIFHKCLKQCFHLKHLRDIPHKATASWNQIRFLLARNQLHFWTWNKRFRMAWRT